MSALAPAYSAPTTADDPGARASRAALDRYARAIDRARTVAAIDAAQQRLYDDLDAARSITAASGGTFTAARA